MGEQTNRYIVFRKTAKADDTLATGLTGARAMPGFRWSGADLSDRLAPLVLAPFVGSFLGALAARERDGMARIGCGAVALSMVRQFAGFTRHVRSGEKGPVCRAPSVIDVITHALRRRAACVHIGPQWLAGFPSRTPDAVPFRVAPDRLRGDVSRYDALSLRYSVLHGFRRRAVEDGYAAPFGC